jgi:hypothetical protein
MSTFFNPLVRTFPMNHFSWAPYHADENCRPEAARKNEALECLKRPKRGDEVPQPRSRAPLAISIAYWPDHVQRGSEADPAKPNLGFPRDGHFSVGDVYGRARLLIVQRIGRLRDIAKRIREKTSEARA